MFPPLLPLLVHMRDAISLIEFDVSYIITSMKRPLLLECSSLCRTYGQKLFLNQEVAEHMTVTFYVVTPCFYPKAFQEALSEQELVGTGRTCNLQ